MKIKLLIAALAISCFSCSSEKLDLAKAKETAESCLKAIDKEDYKTVLSDYYSTELREAGSEEELTGKFKKLKEVTGAMQSYELKESALTAEVGEPSSAILTYVVKHDRVTTNEKFVIINESGKYKISVHAVTNE